MNWQFLDPDLLDFNVELGPTLDVAVTLCRIFDHRSKLFEQERDGVDKMISKRQLQYSSGRHCAHQVQTQLGLQVQAVPRQARVPIWPAGSVGSITHSDDIAGAIASASFRGVGIDIEQVGRVDEKLHEAVFRPDELAVLDCSEIDQATIMFSAKEAGYKSVYPIGQKYIGFQDAKIVLSPKQRSFTIDYLGDHGPNQALNSGVGYWFQAYEHVLTIFVIP